MCFPVSAGKWKLSQGEVRWGFVNEKVCGRFHMDSQSDREQWKWRWMAMAAGADVMESVTPGQRCCEPKLSLLLCSALLARFNRLTALYHFIHLMYVRLYPMWIFCQCSYCFQCCTNSTKVVTSLKGNVVVVHSIYQKRNYLSMHSILVTS